ncbi:MAG: restriction endonuclease [Limnohabitans sp.]|nr:restriction endonuclease [Limnohabitans sp.]
MKFKMSEKSLFAILLRSPWWVSFVVVAVIAMSAFQFLPQAYKVVGMLFSFPLVVIGCMAAWKQRNVPSKQQSEQILQKLSSMHWKDFSALLEKIYTLQEYQVKRIDLEYADFSIEKKGVITLVFAKRWKAATIGVDYLNGLIKARDQLNASNALCINLSAQSSSTLAHAKENSVSWVTPEKLIAMVRQHP